MKNQPKKSGRVDRRKGRAERIEQADELDVRFVESRRPALKPLEPRTEAQHHYMTAIDTRMCTIGSGPAGTGKTYVCARMAAEALQDKRVDRIILTRPAVEAGENLGFLPGEIEEKYEPYLAPFRDVLIEALGRTYFEYCLKEGKIEPAPLAFMRGRTFKNAFVILDEAQNTTPAQMLMFLTRAGENCTIVVNGDLKQKDIPGESGLAAAIRNLEHNRRSAHVAFEVEDVVRHGFVQEVIEAWH